MYAIRPRTIRAFSRVALLLVGAACAAREANAPADVVNGLYRTLAIQRSTGAPSPAQLAELAPFLSAELQALLRDARALHDREAVESPDEKPSFTEGDLFSSLFEGPTAFEIVGDSASDGARRVAVRFTRAGPSDSVTWTDHVVVRSENGRLVVADVEYGGDWAFASKGSLLSSLREGLGPAPSDTTATSFSRRMLAQRPGN